MFKMTFKWRLNQITFICPSFFFRPVNYNTSSFVLQRKSFGLQATFIAALNLIWVIKSLIREPRDVISHPQGA